MMSEVYISKAIEYEEIGADLSKLHLGKTCGYAKSWYGCGIFGECNMDVDLKSDGSSQGKDKFGTRVKGLWRLWWSLCLYVMVTGSEALWDDFIE